MRVVNVNNPAYSFILEEGKLYLRYSVGDEVYLTELLPSNIARAILTRQGNLVVKWETWMISIQIRAYQASIFLYSLNDSTPYLEEVIPFKKNDWDALSELVSCAVLEDISTPNYDFDGDRLNEILLQPRDPEIRQLH